MGKEIPQYTVCMYVMHSHLVKWSTPLAQDLVGLVEGAEWGHVLSTPQVLMAVMCCSQLSVLDCESN